MTNSNASRTLILLLRLSMAWIFLYAASHQVFVPGWSAAGFLESTTTFRWLFGMFTGPIMAPLVSFLVEYGHLLIGLSLLLGLGVRVSGGFGMLLMALSWMAHMNFPFISSTNYLLVDERVVFALVLGLLIVMRAGHVRGLDEWASKREEVHHSRWLSWATA